MAYKNNIPQPNDNLDISQPDILANFAQLDTTMGVNHYDFSDLTVNNGKHKFLQMPEEGAAPATAANEGGLYTKEASGITNLFWRQESSGTEIQMTNLSTNSAAKGHTFLPGGLLLQWGLQGGSSSSSVAVTYDIAFSSAPYCVNVTPVRAASSPGSDTMVVVVTSSVTTSGFTIGNLGSHTMVGWYWMAIGAKV